MQVPIEDIVVKKRIRKDLGDIPSLAESLKRLGQISPIVINNKNILIAGERRLEAAKYLGWRTINAVVANTANPLSILEMEVEENVMRRDFSPEETAEASRRIYRLRNPGWLRRIVLAIAGFFRRLFGIKD
ncbi:MAG: ParB N-terminal domain-containing protein [Treponema sp.]|jgi:ParB family chromosome partitioning protein|nr:ParB N-terminal domain-containing protein [Treponema sp.]